MKTCAIIIVSTCAVTTTAFGPLASKKTANAKPNVIKATTTAAGQAADSRPLFDPLNLYGESTPERLSGRIQSQEADLDAIRPVTDPLNLYSDQKTVNQNNVEMSQAVPFLPRPHHLTGDLPGDAGFDPFNFAASEGALAFQRKAELKHGRIAMLASAGWMASEAFHDKLAYAWHLPSLLDVSDRVPALLNGGLGKVSPNFWFFTIAVASVVEAMPLAEGEIWDPLGLFPKDAEQQRKMELAEIKHGRLAMIAITAFALQEFATKMGVVHGF